MLDINNKSMHLKKKKRSQDSHTLNTLICIVSMQACIHIYNIDIVKVYYTGRKITFYLTSKLLRDTILVGLLFNHILNMIQKIHIIFYIYFTTLTGIFPYKYYKMSILVSNRRKFYVKKWQPNQITSNDRY